MKAVSPITSTPKGVRLASSSTFIQPSVTHKKSGGAYTKKQHEEPGQLVIDGSHYTELCEVFVIIGATDDSIERAVRESEAFDSEYNELFGSGPTGQDVFVSANDSQESSFLMVESQKRSSLLRNIASNNIKAQAQILDSYPNIYNDEINQLTPSANEILNLQASKIKEQYLYLSNIQLICFPDGYTLDADFQPSKLQHKKHPYKIMHYTITQSSGEKKFLTCLEYKDITTFTAEKQRFNEENGTTQLQIKQYTVMAPKCLCLVSRLPLFSIQRQILELIFDDLVKPYYQSLQNSFDNKDPEQGLKMAAQKVPKGILEFYLSTFIHHLRYDSSHFELEIHRDSAKKESVIKYVNAFERNYGSLRIENYEYRMLFQRVRPHMLMQILVCLLHERKVILILGGGGAVQSDGLNSEEDCMRNGALIIETLLSLLYPLQWNFTNISNLIPSMIDYLEAPFPYIVCVSRELWRNIYEHRWNAELCQPGDEVLAFDLDTQRVYIRGHKAPPNVEAFLPEFPQPYTQLVIQQLEKQLQKASEFSSISMRSEDQDLFWKQFTLKVKQQFLNFLIFLINTFENFYNPSQQTPQDSEQQLSGELTPHSSNETLTKFKGGSSANEIFNFQDYVQNVRENQSFFERFVRTQGFINFIEQAHQSSSLPQQQQVDQISEPHLTFFKECTRKLAKENIQAVRQMQDQIINAILDRQQKSIRYSLDKCRAMYDAAVRCSAPNKIEKKIKGGFQVIMSLEKSLILDFGGYFEIPGPQTQNRFNEGAVGQYPAYKATGANKTALSSTMELKFTSNTKEYFTQQKTQSDQRATSNPPLQQRQLIKIEDNMDVETSELKSERNSRSIDDQLQSQQSQQWRSNHHNSSHLLRPTFPQNKFQSTSKIVQEANAEDEIDRSQSASQNPVKHQQYKNEESLSSFTQNQDLQLPLPQDNQSYGSSEDDDNQAKNPSEGDNGPSIISFFKKTFTNVKKTFESTFKNAEKRRPKSKLAGRRTPLVGLNNPDDNEQSPVGRLNRVKYNNGGYLSTSKILTRGQRSQTFHQSTSVQPIQQQPPPALKPEEDSFFTTLLGHLSSSASKQQPSNRKNPDSHIPLPVPPVARNQHNLLPMGKMNNSGFFMFDAEDLKRMTEMSPREEIKQPSLDIEVAIVPPIIKGHHSISNARVRSISYQQPVVVGRQQQQAERQRMVEESLEIIERYGIPNSKKAQDQSSEDIRGQLIGGNNGGLNESAKTEMRKNQIIIPSTISKEILNNRLMSGSQSQNSLLQKQKQLFPQQKQSNQLSLIKEDPTNMSNGGNESSAQPSPARKLKNEFEEVYRKSTENLFFLPNNQVPHDPEKKGKKKFSLWKNQTAKVEQYTRAVSHQQAISNQSKPPKHLPNKKKPSNNTINRSITLISNEMRQTSSFDEEDIVPYKNPDQKQLSMTNNQKDIILNLRSNRVIDRSTNKKYHHEHSHSTSLMQQKVVNHRRQISYQGSGNVSGQQQTKITGPIVHQQYAAQAMTLENIEPDEEEADELMGDVVDQDKTQNIMIDQAQVSLPLGQKQIESMQVGRIKPKGSVSNNQVKQQVQSKRNNLQQTLQNNVMGLKQLWKIEFPQQQNQVANQTSGSKTTTTSNANFKLAFNSHSNSKSKHLPQFGQKSSKKVSKANYEGNETERNINAYQDNDEEEKQGVIRLNYQHIQAKTVESSSSNDLEEEEEPLSQRSIVYPQQMMLIQNANKTQKYQMTKEVESKANPGSPSTGKYDSANLLLQTTQQEDYTGQYSGQRRRPPYIEGNYSAKHTTLHPQNRVHSLSSYYPSNSVLDQIHSLRSKPQQEVIASRIDVTPQQQISSSTVITSTPNTIKPLNKITWDSFSQIAKLTGDVDHEPSTPKSGVGCDINFPDDEDDIDKP